MGRCPWTVLQHRHQRVVGRVFGFVLQLLANGQQKDCQLAIYGQRRPAGAGGTQNQRAMATRPQIIRLRRLVLLFRQHRWYEPPGGYFPKTNRIYLTSIRKQEWKASSTWCLVRTLGWICNHRRMAACLHIVYTYAHICARLIGKLFSSHVIGLSKNNHCNVTYHSNILSYSNEAVRTSKISNDIRVKVGSVTVMKCLFSYITLVSTVCTYTHYM